MRRELTSRRVIMRGSAIALAILAGLCPAVRAQEASNPKTFTISNPLQLSWPGELVHFDVPANELRGDWSAKIDETARPVQIEHEVDAPDRASVWFIASLQGGKTSEISKLISIVPGKTESPLAARVEGDRLVISNGVYDVAVPQYNGGFDHPRSLKEMMGPIAGVRLKGGASLVTTSAFEGEASITSAKTEVVASGPVFILVKLTFKVDSDALQQVHPTTHPRAADYEATLKFVVNDPWIQVVEHYELPSDTRYVWRMSDGWTPDTVMSVRWFGYAGFGGNNAMHFLPLLPVEKQRGPFVALRPRWSQAPGGGQDFLVTQGGSTAVAGGDALAIGVVATHPLQWLEPYNQLISCYAENGNSARASFPTSEGSRAYAILAGPRGLFNSTDKLNSIVRRHADWTLDDQIHKYTLDWKRDPDRAGPHILITRDELSRLQKDFKEGRDTPEVTILKRAIANPAELTGVDKQLADAITGKIGKAASLPSAEGWLSTRYQDDYLNPTGRPVRGMAGAFGSADLAANGTPIGGPWQAAIGYIFTDLNNWPGYHNGWGPGNPNFHTDKYLPAVFAAATMLDHPSAKAWLAFGKQNFDEDLQKVFLPPDGVSFECPGYGAYSLKQQLDIAKVFVNTGYGNPIAENPLIGKNLQWHRQLLTPVDPRLEMRHEAPIGDTHRWGSGANDSFAKVAKYYKIADPPLASELMGAWLLLKNAGVKGAQGSLIAELTEIDHSIPAAPPEQMDWGSHAFFGFGAVMRSRFGTPDETFVTLKAGPARGHYHSDEMSYHFYGCGTPLSLDYNCSYTPRGDHAALHNSVTFGLSKPFTHTGDTKAVDASEMLSGIATVGAFAATSVADAAVAELSGDSLTLAPIYPDDAKFQYPYPTRSVGPIVHRRFLILVKHAPGSKLADYLVIRDETAGNEPPQLNVHLLVRDLAVDSKIANLFRGTGQWNVDALVYLAQSEKPQVTIGRWYYADQSMTGPGEYRRKSGKGEPEDPRIAGWAAEIQKTDGQALIPPKDWKGKWLAGEYQKWLQIRTAPGSTMLWVLYPKKQGADEPIFATQPDGVRVSLGGEADDIHVATSLSSNAKGQVVVRQNDGAEVVVLGPMAVPAIGAIKSDRPIRPLGAIVDDASPAAQPK